MRIKAFARFEIEIWCMGSAYVDQLAKDKNGVKYFVVRQVLLDRTMDARGRKTKDSEKTFRAFMTMITKKNRPRKIWIGMGTDFAGECKRLCKAEGIQFNLTTSETNAC